MARIPADLIFGIGTNRTLYGRWPYQPTTEDLAAEDWELFELPEEFAMAETNPEVFWPDRLWPGDAFED